MKKGKRGRRWRSKDDTRWKSNRLRKKACIKLVAKEGLAGAKARVFILLQLRHD